jgi:hypothetical protein
MAADDDEARYAQALRFLTSLQSQKSQDVVSQKAFLQSKGLSEELIARAFKEIKRPDSIASSDTGTDTVVGSTSTSTSDNDLEAFETAAKMFDEPLNAEYSSSIPAAPPKTYPRSPLALYQPPQDPNQHYTNIIATSTTNPMTRYDVLLGFFRSLCFFLVLGGGMTGAMVALYRTYLMPRMVSTLDSRSLLLGHHLDQYTILTNRIKQLRGNSLVPSSMRDAANAPLKGVLKKVQFADEMTSEKRLGEEEKHKDEVSVKETNVDVLTKEDADEEKQKLLEDEEEGQEQEKSTVLAPVDITEPIRNSLARLNQALRADMSGSAIGTELSAPAPTAEKTKSKSKSALATSVEEESDADSWVSEEDSDELEFDPYSATTKSSSKRKHDPANTNKTSSLALANSVSGTTAVSLNSSLSTLNAYINSQTFMASSHVYGGRTIGMGGVYGATSSSVTDKEASAKTGDVAQIRADIRNLKGLLLSR